MLFSRQERTVSIRIHSGAAGDDGAKKQQKQKKLKKGESPLGPCTRRLGCSGPILSPSPHKDHTNYNEEAGT